MHINSLNSFVRRVNKADSVPHANFNLQSLVDEWYKTHSVKTDRFPCYGLPSRTFRPRLLFISNEDVNMLRNGLFTYLALFSTRNVVGYFL